MLRSGRRRSHVYHRSSGHFKTVLALVRHSRYLQHKKDTDDTTDTKLPRWYFLRSILHRNTKDGQKSFLLRPCVSTRVFLKRTHSYRENLIFHFRPTIDLTRQPDYSHVSLNTISPALCYLLPSTKERVHVSSGCTLFALFVHKYWHDILLSSEIRRSEVARKFPFSWRAYANNLSNRMAFDEKNGDLNFTSFQKLQRGTLNVLRVTQPAHDKAFRGYHCLGEPDR